MICSWWLQVQVPKLSPVEQPFSGQCFDEQEDFMKTIAVSANGKKLEAKVGPLFGRARFFIIVDPDTLEWEAWDNLANLSAAQGIGVMTANRMVRHNIRTVLTGSCGPKAFQELQAAGIEVVLNAQGTVRQALASLKEGKLTRASGTNVSVSY
jgi:predicted Fe-Mo cluster-binding NifX family protein